MSRISNEVCHKQMWERGRARGMWPIRAGLGTVVFTRDVLHLHVESTAERNIPALSSFTIYTPPHSFGHFFLRVHIHVWFHRSNDGKNANWTLQRGPPVTAREHTEGGLTAREARWVVVDVCEQDSDRGGSWQASHLTHHVLGLDH